VMSVTQFQCLICVMLTDKESLTDGITKGGG